MQPFTPFIFTATLIRSSGEIWTRNMRCFQVFFDAAVQQQLALAGMAHPVAAAAGGGAKGGTGRTTPASPPARPKPAPAIDLDNADVPV